MVVLYKMPDFTSCCEVYIKEREKLPQGVAFSDIKGLLQFCESKNWVSRETTRESKISWGNRWASQRYNNIRTPCIYHKATRPSRHFTPCQLPRLHFYTIFPDKRADYAYVAGLESLHSPAVGCVLTSSNMKIPKANGKKKALFRRAGGASFQACTRQSIQAYLNFYSSSPFVFYSKNKKR